MTWESAPITRPDERALALLVVPRVEVVADPQTLEARPLRRPWPGRPARPGRTPRRTGSIRSSPPARTHVRRMRPRALGTRTPDERRACGDLRLALPAWRGDFYPRGLPQRRELEYAAAQLTSVEINGSFYSLQRPESYRAVARARYPRLRVRGQGRPVHHPPEAARATWRRRWPTSSRRACSSSAQPGPGAVAAAAERLTFDADVLRRLLRPAAPHHPRRATLAARHDDKVPEDRAVTDDRADRPLRHALEFAADASPTRRRTSCCAEHGVALRGRRHRRALAEVLTR